MVVVRPARCRHGEFLGLTAALLPYLVFICLAAKLGRVASAVEFRWPSAPSLLNVCWLAAAWCVAPCFAPDKLAQAYVIAGPCSVIGRVAVRHAVTGTLRLGYQFDFDSARAAARRC